MKLVRVVTEYDEIYLQHLFVQLDKTIHFMPTYKILHSFRTTSPNNVHHSHETEGHRERGRKLAVYATLLKS